MTANDDYYLYFKFTPLQIVMSDADDDQRNVFCGNFLPIFFLLFYVVAKFLRYIKL